MSARQAEVQASICVSIGEKKSLVLSALTMQRKLVGGDSRVEEKRSSSGTVALRVYVTAETLARAEMCISSEMNHKKFFGEQTWQGAFEVHRVQSKKQPQKRLSVRGRPLTQ